MIQRWLMAILVVVVAATSIREVAFPGGNDPEETIAAAGLIMGASGVAEALSGFYDTGAFEVERTTATGPEPEDPVLLVSNDSRRRSPGSLAKSSLSGDVYIFLEPADESVELVSFWLDGVSGSPYRSDQNAPYDLAGGSVQTANPLDTSKLSDGEHSVVARSRLSDGSTLVTSATFFVSNQGDVSDDSGSGSSSSTTTTTNATTTSINATTTSTASSPTTTSVSGDVRFKPGDDVESIVSNSPNGTVFVFSPGFYKGLSIEPKTDQIFIGEPGTVLEGNGASFAFRSGNSSVTIDGFEITDYEPSSRDAVVEPDNGGRDWTLVNNEIHHNAEKGVDVTNGWTLTGNHIHHNGRYGVSGSGSGVVISGNEISYNATDYGATGDSGGTKFVHTSGLVLENNYVHHNYGNGLWVDINNVDAVIQGNHVSSNEHAGIFIEISCGGTIRNNTVENNGHANPYPNWMAGSSGIMVSDSPDVDIYGNTLVGNEKGIGAVQVDHGNLGAVTKCTPELKNLDVHDNVITQAGGAAAGIDANNNGDKVWSSWGNSFDNNTYNLSGGAQFRWEGDWISFDEWKAVGLQ